MNKRPVWPWLIGVGVLFAAGSYALRVYRPILTPIHDDIPCITEGLPLLQHLHPELYIYVNGTQEMMPGTIGHFAECEKVLHTHDDNLNLIHVEAQNNAIYTLEDFFRVWGQPIERSGYVLEVAVDGVRNINPRTIPLQDAEKIVLRYTALSR